jgi:signal transduction histidine kinase/Tfp pilus assembly protein PilF
MQFFNMLRYTNFFAAVLLLFSISGSAQAQKQNLEWFVNLVETIDASDSTLRHETLEKLELAYNSKDTAEQVQLYNTLGLIYSRALNDHEKAIGEVIKGFELCVQSKWRGERIFSYLAISKVLKEIGAYPQSRDAIEKAMQLTTDDQLHAYLFSQLAELCYLNGKTDFAYENAERLIDMRDNVRDQITISDGFYIRALVKKQQSNYAGALEDHKEALAIRRELNDERRKVNSHQAIAEVYHMLRNDQRAIDNDKVAFDVAKALKDASGMAKSLNHIGALYLDQKQYDLAVKNFSEALDLARDANSYREISISLEGLSACYKSTGEFEKALRYRDDFSSITELIHNEEIRAEVLATQTEAEMAIEQSKIAQLESVTEEKEKEIQDQKKIQLYLMGVIVLGGVVALLVLFLYISNRRSTRKLKVINLKVKEQNTQLQELNATKDKFFSIISHDLKGPLNSLTSFSGLLINHTDALTKEEIQVLAKDLDKSVKNLFNLLENLLEWSRSQTGNIEFKSERFDLASLLDLNAQLLNQQAATKNISLVNTNNEPLPVNAHKHSINTVIRNLVSNAIKFTPAGGTITLGVKRIGQTLEVSVADTGVGMSKEVMDKLFRIDMKMTTKGTADEKGTGLGLILCKDFIEKNGGRIWVESEVGKGSVFRFTLANLVEVKQEVVSA